MITARLPRDETEANHFREEGCDSYWDRCDRLYHWRHDFRTLGHATVKPALDTRR
jgi:hypothetical protein